MINYEFTLFVFISALISSPLLFIKKGLLKDFKIHEELICTSTLITISLILIYIFYDKKNIMDLVYKFRNYDKLSNYILYVSLIVLSLFISSYIIFKESEMIKYRFFKVSIGIILTIILGIYLFNESINIKNCIGMLIIMGGLYIIN